MRKNKKQASLSSESSIPASVSPTASWVTERLKHAKQIRWYKAIAFCLTGVVIFLMYATFFVLLGFAVFCPEHRAILEQHKHFLGIMLALLIVPSALAWGVVRSVFRSENDSSTDSVAKSIAAIHPYA